ncbi:cardiolipin synthase [Paenibacillus gorillae]|uniref:cardiolipin synthase n=1 Tax=Paenibacillus gorillae TaxID=1243662 RepID=UPI000693E2CA|nr:cardiolipin synthase [Paenibacillus gorillae]
MTGLTGWLTAAAVFFFGLIIQSAIIIGMERKRPAKLAAWLTISLLFPYVGFMVSMFFGRTITGRIKRLLPYESQGWLAARKSSLCAQQTSDIGTVHFAGETKLFTLLTAEQSQQITLRNQTKVLTNGEANYDTLLTSITNAKRHIHLDYYTIRDDEIGRRFLRLLTEKASEGVEVRVLFDGVGSYRLSRSYVKQLEAGGVQVFCFLPPYKAVFRKLLNNRNHSKIAVIDGTIGFVGGMNIGDEYLGKEKKLGFWRDTQLQLEGDSVYWLQELFMKDWAFATGKRLNPAGYMPAHAVQATGGAVLIVSSGPDRNGAPILETVFAAVTAARSRIYLTTPYFIPDASLLTALCIAAKSGIDVRVIIPGIADTQLVLWATLSYVEPLLQSGVKVYRYQKGFIHAKVLLVDQMVASVGTANMDMRSFHSNYEQNAMLFDEAVIARLDRDFAQDMLDSEQLELKSFRQRPRMEKVKEAAAQLLSPLL